MNLISLLDASAGYGKLLWRNVTLHLAPGQRVALMGANGSGKSTLFKVLARSHLLEEGILYHHPGLKVGYLGQEPLFTGTYVQDVLGNDFRSRIFADVLDIDLNAPLGNLSGGEKRRVNLALVLLKNPDVLLLDEPTNHLDIAGIEWLEQEIANKTAIIVSHDREFLEKTTNEMWWLRSGRIYTFADGFKRFDDFAQKIDEQEAINAQKLKQKLQQEEKWLHGGVTARRKRNQRRLKELYQLRQEAKAIVNTGTTEERLALSHTKASKRLLVAKKISFAYQEKPIFNNFDLILTYKQRIGVIGPNGVGKTTLLKILADEMQPDSGEIVRAKNLNINYISQQPKILDLQEVFANSWLNISMHEYLRGFSIPLDQDPSSMSGGQKQRLALACNLAKASNLLFLDEPTNDLDIAGVEFLVEVLSDYQGAIFIISHDRRFLDELVTSWLRFEDGNIREYFGDNPGVYKTKQIVKKPAKSKPKSSKTTMSYKDQYQLETALPQKIATLETEIAKLEAELLQTTDHIKLHEIGSAIGLKRQALHELEEQWLELSYTSQPS